MIREGGRRGKGDKTNTSRYSRSRRRTGEIHTPAAFPCCAIEEAGSAEQALNRAPAAVFAAMCLAAFVITLACYCSNYCLLVDVMVFYCDINSRVVCDALLLLLLLMFCL